MQWVRSAWVVLALNLGNLTSAQAGIINGSFETGNLTGWTASPSSLAGAVSSYHTFSPAPFTPIDGNFFALLSAGAGANVYTTLSQSFSANAGDTISGWAFFQAVDYMPFNDDAYVRIVQGNQILFASSVSAVGDLGSTPWTFFSYTFPSSGTFTIEAGVRNVADNLFNSVLGLDNVRLSSASVPSNIPAPSSLAVFSLAATTCAGYLSWRRRQRLISA
jgi:hypothetical protein